MPRAYDAPSDDGNDYPEVYDDWSGPGDAEASALVEIRLPEREDDGEVLREDEAFSGPRHQQGNWAEDTSGRDIYDVPTDTRFPFLRNPAVERAGEESSFEDDSASADGVIAESLHETVEAAEEWFLEKTLEWAADAVHPGAGRLISIALKIKEMVGDAEALASPDDPRNLHVPLFDVTGSLAVDLNVHLRGDDESGDDAPLVSGFLSPGDDGLFGGWQIETERPAAPAQGEGAQSGRHDHPGAAGQAARPTADEAARTRHPGPPRPPVIDYDLSAAVRQVQGPWRRAAALRTAASLLRTRLYARPEFAAEPILVIYDPPVGLGMWLVNPEFPGAVAGRRITIRLNPVTGMTTVFIE
jgi:hypothetical protein